MNEPKPPTEVEGIESLRISMIVKRDIALKEDDFETAVLYSHVIAWLGFAESVMKNIKLRKNK